ncbi:2,3-bisphosphoglycerate-independent phosphoglycerate mutase [Bryobacter aggregatus]|uniref:2,3-bisphosphoglycerate-independent phosphoglycerate mutase n=1 Tax=Bryobacter aggregatus TaxID=360054 RepID=UPI0004E0FE2C|nr:2,3-bisphosphoglycerate-independent phosphoglycerate mutase [Bryobacter aggregatus]
MSKPDLVVLTILDGFGWREETEGNAVIAAHKPNFDRLWAANPHTLIEASGPWVGLPVGQMGNSEVGHLNIGSGRIVRMDVSRIDYAIETGEFFELPELKAAMQTERLHLLGLVSDGGVHSMNTHLYALLDMARREGVKEVYVHCFMDGRDTPPQSGAGFLKALEPHLGNAKIASVMGRYYAMDRDKRWERVEKAAVAMTALAPLTNTSALAAVEASYAAGTTDEFVEPVTIVDGAGKPVGPIQPGDSCIFFNYRADRARELTERLTKDGNLRFTMMTEYDRTFTHPFVFKPETHENVLGDWLSRHGIANLRVAETEKYPHVTFFFNGGIEKPYEGEAREMVASPKVATYDLMPEMSAAGVCQKVVDGIESGKFGVIVVNFANPDMVGHSGVFAAAVKAVETSDYCVGKIEEALNKRGNYAWIITADHGNSETMIDPVTKGPHTYHTTNPVPVVIVDQDHRELRTSAANERGSLRDLAPTMLDLLGIPQPPEMTGASLRK